MAILGDIIWSSSRVLSIEWLLTFLPPLWSETLYPKKKTNLDNLSSRKTKILWGYCYPMGRHHGQKLFLFGKWPSQDAIIHEGDTKRLPLMALASLLCMVAKKIIGVIQTPLRLCEHPQTPRLSQFYSPKRTHRLGRACISESFSLFLSFLLLNWNQAADKPSSSSLGMISKKWILRENAHSNFAVLCVCVWGGVLSFSRPWTLWAWGFQYAVLEDPSISLPAHDLPMGA